ncbi:MAG: sugar phosphate nucleotidyltransferase [Methanomicrobium sp.]|nr:sugar phosphate nucleotidyltransferase [Methanomicrobium sp.]
MNHVEYNYDTVIFCGGRGTRLSEKTKEMPKPLIELGDYPVIWHIMKVYSHSNFNKFVLTLGYKGEMIADYFLNHHSLNQNFTVNLSDIKKPPAKENWEISFVQTGTESKTAKRLLLCRDFIKSKAFMATYGDGVADIDFEALINKHNELKEKYGIIATITITKPYSKYGIVKLNDGLIESFREKPQMDEYINVGFMVLERKVFDYINPDEDVMFEETLQKIADDKKLGYYVHDGFWHAMDTYKDYEELNEIWKADPKWKVWKD